MLIVEALAIGWLVLHGRTALAVQTQLCFAIDGSGSIAANNFAAQLQAIADAVANPNIVPQNGSLEVSVVQFPGGVEVPPTVIDSAQTAADVATQITSIVQSTGLTPMEQGITDCTAAITTSPVFAVTPKQVINLATDGVPTDAQAALAARDAAMAAGIDQLHAEAVGQAADTGFLLDLVWPQPGELVASGETPTDPETTGFVLVVEDFATDFAAAIQAKVAAIVGITCAGQLATIVGTDGNDILIGTPGDDVIAGLGGNDRIYGLGGNDIICGGPGNDRIDGGAGDDFIDGGEGDDDLYGQSGNDTLRGGPGNDRLYGQEGDDNLDGGEGYDLLNGGTGTDTCINGERLISCEILNPPLE